MKPKYFLNLEPLFIYQILQDVVQRHCCIVGIILQNNSIFLIISIVLTK